MIDGEETVGTESKFVEYSFNIKTALCLATSESEDGTPIKVTEALRRYLPLRIFGRIQLIEENGNKFSISLLNDPRNFHEFLHKFNSYYSDPVNRRDVEEDNVEEGGLYVCRIGKDFHRCRLLKIHTNTFSVFLYDVGSIEKVEHSNLYYIDFEFHGDLYNYAFALRCSTPDAAYLNAQGLPTLQQFKVGDVVDVVVCSLYEPCLALIGSTNKHFTRLYPARFVDGLEELTAALWQSNFLNPMPSFEGVTNGQYPTAQSTASDRWHLTTIASCNSLSSIYVRDIASSVRLNALQEIINDFYGAETCREHMRFPANVQLFTGLPCVVFDELSRQFMRAVITDLSGDRTVLDINCVDYPSLTFKGVKRDDLFMLFAQALLPPQCFTVKVMDIDDAAEIHHYTHLAKHFLDVGSVAAVYLSPKSTVASLRICNNEDLLEKIGFKQKEDKTASAVKPFPDWLGFTNLKSTEKLPYNNDMSSFRFRSSFFNNLEPTGSRQSAAVSPKQPEKPRSSILKNAGGGVVSTTSQASRPPISAVEVFIVYIGSFNRIYYRNRELAASYASLQQKLKELWDQEKLVPVAAENLRNVGVGRNYLLQDVTNNEIYRIKVLNNETKPSGVTISYIHIDDGLIDTLIPMKDVLYTIPLEIERWPSTVVGPCRLSTDDVTNVPDTLNKYENDLRATSKLRNMLDKERVWLVARDYGSNEKTSKDNMDTIQQSISIYRSDGSLVNESFFAAVKAFIDDERKNQTWK